MTEQNLAFPIPNSILEPYIKTAVSSAITAALGDGTALIEAAVQRALTEKVDRNGNKSCYSSENKYDVIEVLATNEIQKIAKDVIVQMAEGMRPQIKKSIETQISKKHSVIAQTLVDSLIGSLTSSWNVSVSIDPKAQR